MALVQKVYLSNLSTIWPEDRQRSLIKVPMNDQTVFADLKLSKAARKERRVDALKQRAELLRALLPAAHDEIHVASLASLVFDRRDLLDFAAVCAERGATIVAYHGDVRIEPTSGAVVLAQASDRLVKDKQGGATEKSRAAAAQARRQETLRKLGLVRHLWPLKTHTTEEIRLLAGTKQGGKVKPMAPATLKAHLGSRPEVQRDLYEVMKGRAYGVAEIATGCTNADAIQCGFIDVYALLMSDSDHPRMPGFLALLPGAIPSEAHRQILLDGLARQFANAPGWLAYVDRETSDG